MGDLSMRVEEEGPKPWLQWAGDPRFRFVTVHVPVADLPAALEGFRILFITDIHLRESWEPVLDAALPRIREARPRMVLCGGDFVEDKKDHRKALPFVARMLEELQTEHGMFAVTGNHDTRLLTSRNELRPVRFVVNQRAWGGPAETPIEIIGLSGHKPALTTEAILRSFPAREKGVPRIVLSHYPDRVREAGPILRPDLYLAGHTHGGQVALPLPGGRRLVVMTHDELPKRCAAGAFEWEGTRVIVSRGLGFSKWQVRAFCPPEVHLIELARGDSPRRHGGH